MATILISAGDLSGEAHGAGLVRALRARRPDIRFVGMGGAAMAAAGVELAVDQRTLAVGGIFELIGSLGRVVGAWRRMSRCLRETRPDLVILIDSGGFHLPFARRVRRLGPTPILYYVAPQVWAWRPGRLRKLVERSDRIATILPFEPAFYRERGIEVDFVGHPVVDRVASERISLADARAALGLDPDAAMLGIFPGSRRNELEQILPIQLEALQRLRASEPDLRRLGAVVGLAPTLDRGRARDLAERVLGKDAQDLVFADGGDGRVLEACDVALVKPGTITVEALLREKPMVVVGRVNAATAALARRSLKLEWLAMPNLIAGREIVPERLQDDARPDRIAAALAPLFGGPARTAQVQALRQARLQLGEPGAADRVAAIVEEMLGTA